MAWEEGWEYGEEVEENYISTLGQGVRPNWMTDEEAAQFERDHSQVISARASDAHAAAREAVIT